MKRDAMIVVILNLALLLMLPQQAAANPYLAKPSEAPIPIRVSNCAVSGGFTHMYAAVDAHLFDKYGLRTELIYIQGSGPGLTALTTNEIQFLYCAGDATRR
jgi:ABC-type nitrate/sulfonate/bicarbonate transport system substrate-binding protein